MSGRFLGRTALYALLFLACFYIGSFFVLNPGGSLWFPAAGLRLAVLLIFGWRLTPGLVVAEIVAVALYGVLRPQTRYSDPTEVLLVGQTPLIYGLAAFLLARESSFDRQLRRPRDLVWLSAIAAVVPLVAAAENRMMLVWIGRMELQDSLHSMLSFVIGDTIGILMLTPPLLVAYEVWRTSASHGTAATDPPIDFKRLLIDFVAVWAFLIGLHQVPMWFDQLTSNIQWYLAFLPILWIAFRHGLVGAIAGTVAVIGGAAWLTYWPIESIRFQELQILVAFLSIAGLLLGSAISNQVRTERQLALKNQKLLAVQEQLEDRNEDLGLRNEELEQFAYAVSHDLKAPLVTIRGFLRFLKKDTEAGNVERVRRDIEHIDTSAQTMQMLLEDLLELSRASGQPHSPQAVALGEVAQQVRELLAGDIADRGVDIEIAPDLPVVQGDPGRLLQVFQNLLQNAIRYMGEQPAPRVEIGCQGQGREEKIYVRDNGIGIEPQNRDKIFGLFERLDPNLPGTGIGLALVKKVVDRHGGRIWVESEGRGQGSTFCLKLPRISP